MSDTTTKRTGPATPEGKRRASMNALKHGLTASSPQALEKVAQEYGIELLDIRVSIQSHYRPADPIEAELVERIALCLWRLRLSKAMEQRLIVRHPSLNRPGPAHERIMRYERLVDIHLHRAIATLAQKREDENKLTRQNDFRPRSF